MNNSAAKKNYLFNTLLLLVPFWGTPLVLAIGIPLAKAVPFFNSIVIPMGLVLLASGALPILRAHDIPMPLRAFFALGYWFISTVITFFYGWWLLLSVFGARP